MRKLLKQTFVCSFYELKSCSNNTYEICKLNIYMGKRFFVL